MTEEELCATAPKNMGDLAMQQHGDKCHDDGYFKSLELATILMEFKLSEYGLKVAMIKIKRLYA